VSVPEAVLIVKPIIHTITEILHRRTSAVTIALARHRAITPEITNAGEALSPLNNHHLAAPNPLPTRTRLPVAGRQGLHKRTTAWLPSAPPQQPTAHAGLDPNQ